MPPNPASAMEGSSTPGEELAGPWWRAPLWHACHWLTWIVTLSLGVVAAERILDHDGALLLTWLNAFTRYVYLPAYACLAWAIWQRRWLLMTACAVVASCHVVWMAPDFIRDRRFDVPTDVAAEARPSKTVRIFFANVAGLNREHEAMLKEIADADPDVIVLAEYTWPWHVAFRASPVMAPYTFGSGLLKPQNGSISVFSKIPIASEQLEWIEGRGVKTSEFQLGDHTLRVVGLHAPRPMYFPLHDYDGYWQAALPKLQSMPGATVIVGDFNATEHSHSYQQLKSSRYRSAHEDRGRGYATTWPNGQFMVPPIRIDQAMISPDVECMSIVEGKGRGSDHKPLILDVRVRNAESDSTAVNANMVSG